MTRMIFLMDVDEVLAEFCKAVVALVEKQGHEFHKPAGWDFFSDMDPELRSRVFKEIEKPGFCLNLQVCDGAVEGVRRLRQLGCDIYAVTSPWDGSLTWHYERTLWLKEHFDIDGKKVVFAHDKSIVAGDFFLDDKPYNVVAWANLHLQSRAMLWDTPFNQDSTARRSIAQYTNVSRVKSWGEVIGIVCEVLRNKETAR